jgi:hypothetical protein
MNPHVTRALVAARQAELERQAGCCTPAAEHRRSLNTRGLRQRVAGHFGVAQPQVCCA